MLLVHHSSTQQIPSFMRSPDINEVSKKVIDLIESINEILRISFCDDSNLLSELGVLKTKEILKVPNSSYQLTIERVSDAFLHSIDANSVCEWVSQPFPEEKSSCDSKDIYQELRKSTCLAFQAVLPEIHKSLLESGKEAFLKAPPNEKISSIFREFSKQLAHCLPPLGNVQKDLFLIEGEARLTSGESLKAPAFLETSNKIYLFLREKRYHLFDGELTPMVEFCPTLRRSWICLEKSMIQEMRPPFSPHLQSEGFFDEIASDDYQTTVRSWHALLESRYGSFSCLPLKQAGFSLDHTVLEVEFKNVLHSTVHFQFHAPSVTVSNLKHFSQKPIGGKAPLFDESDYSNVGKLTSFTFPTRNNYNCMSFGVGRKASREIPPAGKEPTPHKFWDVVQQLKDCGCIHLEELVLNLPIEKSSKEPSYLAAFVHDSGGGESGNPDCHVYRCFFDPVNKTPIWMELLKQGGSNAIKFATKQGDQATLIRGIPADPWNWFCKGGWNTFIGYWLIPPEAKFIVKELMQEKTISFYREQKASIVI